MPKASLYLKKSSLNGYGSYRQYLLATDVIKQGLFQYCTQDFPDILEAYREAECEDYAWQVVGIRLDESGQQIVLTLMPNLDFAAEEYGLPDWPVDTLYIDLQCESDKIKISRIYD